MKKNYSSPDIVFESFSLSTSVASCGIKNTTPTSGECGMVYGIVTVFTDRVGGCSIKIMDGSPLMDGFCYHVPIEHLALFSS